MHIYEFAFSNFNDGKPVREGSVRFPPGISPYIPKVGDEVSYNTNDKTAVAGTVRGVRFNFQYVKSDNLTRVEITI